MTDLVIKLARQADALAPEDRARLAETLLATLDTPADPETDARWDEELRRRIAEVKSGAIALAPVDEVFTRARYALA